MANDYNGVGYTSDPVHSVQEYLASRWSATPPADIYNAISSTLTGLGATAGQLQNFIQQYGENNYFPQKTDGFVSALTNYIQTNGSPGFDTAANRAALKSTILLSIKNSLSLENAGFDQATIAAALLDPSLQPNSATFYNDVYDSAFGSFLQDFNYTKNAVDGTAPTGAVGVPKLVNPAFFRESFQDFFVKFATVVNPTDSSVNFQQIYDAFFGTGNPAFTAFLANYINSVLYPAPGELGTFLPNENIGDWMKKVQESYSIALNGSAAPTTSSVGQSFKKVVIIDQVLRLIIQMIGTLQKVAAMQSDRLRLLTLQQSAYTTLMTQIPVFTGGDGTVFSSTTFIAMGMSKDEAQKARDQANNYNQTLTETVRSRRTTVQDDAKVLQSNINQSNDSANDQASTATALLQTLSSLLGAIFR